MSNVINLPSVGGYHFGSMFQLNGFINKHFEEINPTTSIINKAIILKLK